MSRHVRVYRRLVRLYPVRFRQDYADEMVRLFADQLRDAQASHSTRAVAGLWARSLVDLVVMASTQHLREERAMPQTVEPGAVTAATDSRPPRRLATTVAAGPALIWAVLSLAAPGFTEPFYANPPALLGLPAGICVMVVAAVLTLFGLLLVRRARSPAGVIVALACFTLPATILIIVGPALVLILLNL